MARLHVKNDHVHIELTVFERVAGLMRSRRIPIDAITDVALVGDPLSAVAGMRAPGLAIPGRSRIGTWRGRGRRAFVCVRRDVPAVRIEVTGLDRDEFIVSDPSARSTVDQILAISGGIPSSSE